MILGYSARDLSFPFYFRYDAASSWNPMLIAIRESDSLDIFEIRSSSKDRLSIN